MAKKVEKVKKFRIRIEGTGKYSRETPTGEELSEVVRKFFDDDGAMKALKDKLNQNQNELKISSSGLSDFEITFLGNDEYPDDDGFGGW